jgi:hypothetical protein
MVMTTITQIPALKAGLSVGSLGAIGRLAAAGLQQRQELPLTAKVKSTVVK